MGHIFNKAGTGDPLTVIHAAGFNSVEDASTYWKSNGTQAEPLFLMALARGESIPFNGDPVVLLWVGMGKNRTFLSITQFWGDISAIELKSRGWQLLLSTG